MLALTLEAVLLGVALSVTPGPALLMLLDVSVRSGRSAGVSLALGLATNDLVFALLAYLGMLSVLSPAARVVVGVIGALVLVVMGLLTLRAPTRDLARDDVASGRLSTYWLRGMLLNLFNPFVWVFWISAAGAASARPGQPGLVVMLACVAGIFAGDLTKVVLADRLRSRLGPLQQTRLRRIAGVGLIAFGLHTAWATTH
jgi:amino acid exporter